MKAVIVRPPAAGVALAEVDPPGLHPGTVRVAVHEVGVCGTDRDIVGGLYGTAPRGSDRLILGHENLGRVMEVGSGVDELAPGDWVVSTVRRGCGQCRFCATGRSDFCETGKYTERGIRGADGYLAEQYVERPEYMVKVPPHLTGVAVLLEPLSVVEKAFDEGRRVTDRKEPTPGHPRPPGGRALVTGTGAIGMLAALLLRTEGYDVTVVDRHSGPTLPSEILATIGARHVDVSQGLSALGEERFDLAIEGSGSAALDLDLPRFLSLNGTLVLTGIPPADGSTVPVAAGALWRSVVLENQTIVGSVNANRGHFRAGIRHLVQFRRKFGTAVDRLITARHPMSLVGSVLADRTPGSIKTVLSVSGGIPG